MSRGQPRSRPAPVIGRRVVVRLVEATEPERRLRMALLQGLIAQARQTQAGAA